LNIVRTNKIYESTAPITEVGGSFSDLSLWVFWRENQVLMTKALHKSMVTDINGMYQGSLSSGRWTGAVEFSTVPEDSSPALLIIDGEVSFCVWARNGKLYIAPQRISKYIRAADCALTTKLDSGAFTIDMVNKDGVFTKGECADLFENEKSVGLEIGYNGEYVRIATSQSDSSDANKSRSGSTISVTTKNKFYDLLQMTMTKNYPRKFTVGAKTTVLEDYALSDTLAAKDTTGYIAEVRIDAPNGMRWVPGSVSIANLTEGVTASDVYGQTEFFAFVRLTNTTDAAIDPVFDVLAQDNTSSGRRVGKTETVTGESKTLSGTTAVRLTNKSIDGSKVINVSVVFGDIAYTNGPDYTLAVDSEGYTTIARTAASDDGEGSTIPDGSTVTVGYTYISTFSFTLSFSNAKTAQDFAYLYPYSQPESYQVVVTEVRGRTGNIFNRHWTDKTDNYYATYRPYHLFYTTATNGAGIQIILNQKAYLTVTFEIWARPMETEQVFGEYMTVKEIFADLVKRAAYKDIMFYEYDDDDAKLEEGQFTSLDDNGKDLFFAIEEGFDVDTLRIENTGTADVNITILEAGYILDNDGSSNWGVKVAVTRAYYSLLEVSYSFQIWGQYTERKDFLPPLVLEMDDLADTELTAPLQLIDVTIEEALRKLLQICFYDGNPYKIFAGARGQIRVVPYKADRLDNIKHTFRVRNVAEIAKTRQIPLVIDRAEIKGSISSLKLVEGEIELAHNQSSKIVAKKYHNSNDYNIYFDKFYVPSSYEFRNIRRTRRGYLSFAKKTPSMVTVRAHNKTSYNKHSVWFWFEIWAKPITGATYQEQYIYKTNPNIGGRYTYTKADVENELITNATTAEQVADNLITESCQDYLYLQPDSCPAHPGLEQVDTVKTTFDDMGDDQKGIIKEIDFKFDGQKPAKLTMDVKIAPRVPFAAGFGAENLAFLDDDSLDEDYEIGEETDDARTLYNLLFG
jgi:hypothetical protein